MAEFQKVLKQWRRMCCKINSQGACAQFCPICSNPICGDLQNASDEQIAKAETEIMRWAAEHPELRYPTWWKWLVANVPGTDADSIYKAVQVLNRTRIQYDIAQKLGLQPKEG